MTPLEDFKERLEQFARGERRGIRNPFVIVPIDPHIEYRVSEDLGRWAATGGGNPPINVIRLDEVFPRTEVFEVVTSVPKDAAGINNESVEETLQDNLGPELVETIVEEHPEVMEDHQVVLLLNLGSLYPFTRASELLDELDRLRVRATIGIPFPGRVLGGKLSFFGEDARHYYPAHRAGDDQQVQAVHLQ